VIRAATCALLLLGGCAHVDRPLHPDDKGKKQARHVTLVVCVFASCHHILHPQASELDGDD